MKRSNCRLSTKGLSAHLHSRRSGRSFVRTIQSEVVSSILFGFSVDLAPSTSSRAQSAHDVSLADDVIFRELSVNPLFSFFHAIVPLALSLAPPRTLFVFIRLFPLIRSEGRFPGSCPLSSTSDVALKAPRKHRQTGFVLYVPY